jgi:4-hydroxy-L-threonine phosphate dehydrogenase PdxA
MCCVKYINTSINISIQIQGVEQGGISAMNGYPPGVPLHKTAMHRAWMSFTTKEEYLPEWRQSNNSVLLLDVVHICYVIYVLKKCAMFYYYLFFFVLLF